MGSHAGKKGRISIETIHWYLSRSSLSSSCACLSRLEMRLPKRYGGDDTPTGRAILFMHHPCAEQLKREHSKSKCVCSCQWRGELCVNLSRPRPERSAPCSSPLSQVCLMAMGVGKIHFPYPVFVVMGGRRRTEIEMEGSVWPIFRKVAASSDI